MKRRACIGILLAVLLLVMLPPALALADAPITRGPEAAGQGSVGVPSRGAGGVSDGTAWRGVRELPPSMPPQGAIAAPAYAPRMQQGDGGNGALAWLDRQINPGNWILDAGMGIFAGIVKMFGGMMQKAAQTFLGTASVLPSGTLPQAWFADFADVDASSPYHPSVETIFRDGRQVGWLTGAGWGYTVAKNIGFGYVRNREGIAADWLTSGRYELEVANERVPADLHLAPLYDPGMARIKA